jgi:hypothetical protein
MHYIEEKVSKIFGAEFTNILYITDVKTSAKYKNMKIRKSTSANVQIYANLSDVTEVYKNAILKNGVDSNGGKITSFEVSDNWFTHKKKCYSIVYKEGKEDVLYLWCRMLKAKSEYFIDDIAVEKAEILQYLTPSEVKKLTEDTSIVHNVKNDVDHSVIIRTIKLSNITEIL